MNTVARQTFPRLCAFFASLFCLLALYGCGDSVSMPGDVASVNGQGISFREVETRRIHQFAGRSPEAKTRTEAELQAQYRYVVDQIIEELVICQYMEKKKFVLEPGLVEAEEKLVRDDYPENAFEQMLAEEGVTLDDWRERLRRRLVINQFLTQVLRPDITITADEVQRYFSEHSSDFLIPEQWHFIQITGLDKKVVENARDALLTNKNATAVRKQFLVSIHDIRMGMDRLPEDLTRELSSLSAWKSSPVKAVENEFRTFVLLDKTPATMLEAGEMAKRVEQALLEEKMRDLYTAWVSKRVRSSDIRLAPALFAEISQAAEPAPASAQPHNATGNGAVKVNAVGNGTNTVNAGAPKSDFPPAAPSDGSSR